MEDPAKAPRSPLAKAIDAARMHRRGAVFHAKRIASPYHGAMHERMTALHRKHARLRFLEIQRLNVEGA